MASSQPPPSAKPLTAAMTGLGLRSNLPKITWPRRARATALIGVWPASSLMSAPAMKARPAPVRITPPTVSSAMAWSMAAPSSPISALLSALSLSGRLTVMVAMRSATE